MNAWEGHTEEARIQTFRNSIATALKYGIPDQYGLLVSKDLEWEAVEKLGRDQVITCTAFSSPFSWTFAPIHLLRDFIAQWKDFDHQRCRTNTFKRMKRKKPQPDRVAEDT